MVVFAVAGLLIFGCGFTPGDYAADVIKQHADVTEKYVFRFINHNYKCYRFPTPAW